VSPRAVVAAALLAAAPAARGGDAVEASATLHLRATALGNAPETDVRYDPAARTFALDGYLVPDGREGFASGYASFALDGRHRDGDLRWRVQLDTGELRRRRFPELVPVCLSDGATGLASPGSGDCLLVSTRAGPRPVVVPLESTALADAEATANGRPLADELEETLLLREAYVAASLGRAGFATLRAGRRRMTVAEGFVHDDYGTGLEAELDLGAIGPPFALSGAIFEPSRGLPGSVAEASPTVAVRADWLPSLFEHAGLFLALHRDRSGGIAELLRGALVERLVTEYLTDPAVEQRDDARLLALLQAAPAESDALLAWAGTSGSLLPGRGQRLDWTLGLLRGRIDHIRAAVRPDPSQPPATLAEDLDLSGRLVWLRWEADVGRRLTAGAWFLYLSGDELPRRGTGLDAPLTGTYGGFIGLAPFVTATNLFFGGGLSESFAAREVSAPGVNGRGVVAPGLTLDWDVAEGVALALNAAWLRADAPGPFGGRGYGTEVDVEVRWRVARWLQLGAEADALFPGDFFPGDAPSPRRSSRSTW